MNDTKRAKKSTAPLILSLIGLIVLVRFLSVFVMPWGQKVAFHLEGLNDEPAHFNYVKYLAVNKKFPVLEQFILEEDAFTRNEFEYHQAPLYYLLCAPLYALLGEQGARVAARLVSTLAGFLTLWVLALLLYDLGFSSRVRLAAIVFTGLLPSHLYFSSFVSNDPLSWLFALLFTRELTRFIAAARRSPCPPMTMGAVRAAVYLAAGLLTKTSFAVLFPVPGVLLGWLYVKHRDARFLWNAALIMAAAAVVAAPWYLRNIALYHTVSGIPPSTVAATISFSSISGLVKGTIKYFWFPMQHLQGGTTPFFLLTAMGAGIAFLHGAVALWWLAGKFRRHELTLELTFLTALFCLVAAVHAWYYLEWLNPEARFLFPALAPLVILFLAPMHQVFVRFRKEHFFIAYCTVLALFPYAFLPFAG